MSHTAEILLAMRFFWCIALVRAQKFLLSSFLGCVLGDELSDIKYELIGETAGEISRIISMILLLNYIAFYLSWSRLVNKYQFWIVMAIAIIFMAMAENTGK